MSENIMPSAEACGSSFLDHLRASAARGEHYRDDGLAPSLPADISIRLIAYYLPQFHPIPENDLWWGKGFTEWTNVTKAVPQFVGHYQPRLPGELGFYDLRLPDIMRRQADLARKYGIFGFCIHYYWFGGRTLLEAPLNLLLSNPDIDLPFCICWANENWTRRWDGNEQDILLAQAHSPEDDVEFAKSLERVFSDPRYIRIRGRPLLIVYRPGLLPNPLATARRWRRHLARAGLGNPYLVMAQSFGDEDPRPFGFDAAVEFPPHKLGADAPRINSALDFFNPAHDGLVYDYEHMVRRAAAAPRQPYTLFPAVCPAWDNEARKPGRGSTFAFSTPTKYGSWLGQACHRAIREIKAPEEHLVFINAWNEWGEGAHLEPDRHFGYAYLHETARVLASLDLPQPPSSDRLGLVLVVHDAHVFGAQMLALHLVELFVQQFGLRVHVLLGTGGSLEEAFRRLAPTERVEGGFADLGAWQSVAERLAGQGFVAALCNTVVSAQVIEPLRAAGLRCVSLVHELPSLMRQYRLEQAAAVAATKSEAIVFPSSYVRDRFVEFAGDIDGRSVIRPQGLYLPPAQQADVADLRKSMRAELGIPAAAKVVLGVANGDLRKGLDLWPALMRGILEAQPDTFFVWVGRVEPYLLTWIRHDLEVTGHTDRLMLPGLVEDLKPLYSSADLFLLTSREDPFPSVVLDAMAYGLPVVAFEDSGGITDLVRSSGGLLVPYLDVDAMQNAICRLLQDEPERIAIGDVARQTVKHEFDFADYGIDLIRLVDPTLRTISVVVPNYNYAGYLRQRIESIWSQTYPVYEVIVLDDASTDESAVIITDLQRASGRRIRIVRNSVNSGSVSRQWALGVGLSRGELVWIAEADDFAEPDFLARAVEAFDDPTTVLSYCQSRQVDEKGVVIAEDYLDYVSDIDSELWRNDYHRSGVEEIEEALAVKNTIPNVSAALFRRDALDGILRAHLGEMVKLRNAADWLCYVRLLTQGSVAFTAQPLNNHRRHERSTTLAASDRRHVDEIGFVQGLAGEVATVRAERCDLARRWRESVASHFGIPHEEAPEYMEQT